MATITGVGPSLDVDGPLPVAPQHALLSVPGVVQENDGRWMNGIVVDGYADHAPSLWEPCSTGTFRTKDEDVEGPKPRFDPIGIYYPLACSVRSGRSAEFTRRRSALLLEATLSFGVARALSQGVPLSTNPNFSDANFVPLTGAAVSPEVGLRYLENAIGLTGREGMIHSTPAVTAAWFGLPQTDFPQLRTANGTPVASDGGYIGAHPVGGGGLPGPAATIDWIFATGPVVAYIGELFETEISETVDQADNTVVFRAERFVLPEWDTALQVGVRIDWSL